jgi:biopolymer transport protein ExbB
MNKKRIKLAGWMLMTLATVLVAQSLQAQQSGGVPPARPPQATGQPSAEQVRPAVPQQAQPQLAQAQPPSADQPPASEDPGAGGTGTPRPVSSTERPQRDMSPWSMFRSADALVQTVMVCLALASLVTWTIFLAMSFHLFRAQGRVRRAMVRIANVKTLSEAQLALGSKRNVVASLLAAVTGEIRASADNLIESGLKERVATRFSEIIRMEARTARQGMGLLATIGSVSPFVGLFGTVWGIMNSFIGISKSQTTNLAVVAPGIAEALLATALGLVAAIPAVIIYNHFARRTRSYLELVNRASGAIGRLLSRDLDRTQGQMHARAAE